MGTSFVKYGEYGFWTRDTDLSGWFTALLAELRKTTKPEPWHKRLMEHWNAQIEVDGGCMSAALDQFLTDSERRDSLISTSELALRNCDLSAKRTGELFVALLRGTLKTTASSPIDYLGDPSQAQWLVRTSAVCGFIWTQDELMQSVVVSAHRVVPILFLCALVLAAFGYWLMGKNHETLGGVIVLNDETYEFYPDAKDCNYRGIPYVLLPNASFREIVAPHADLEHLDRLFHGVWRAKINGNLSRIGWFKYRKTYWRELSVNYVVDAMSLSCGDER